MITNQAYLFLIFCINGIIIGLLFDFFRILRRSFKTHDIVTYIQDVLFWILTGLLILYNIWYFNNGEIRIFMFLGIIMGILIYMSTLSNILIKISLKILRVIINVLELPFKTIIGIFSKIFTSLRTFFTKITKKFTIKEGNFENNGE